MHLTCADSLKGAYILPNFNMRATWLNTIIITVIVVITMVIVIVKVTLAG